MELNITDVRVFKLKNKIGALIGFANIVINDNFAVKGIRIIETDKGRFVAMPANRLRNRRNERYPYRDVCHPINQETRDAITNAVLEAFDKEESK